MTVSEIPLYYEHAVTELQILKKLIIAIHMAQCVRSYHVAYLSCSLLCVGFSYT